MKKRFNFSLLFYIYIIIFYDGLFQILFNSRFYCYLYFAIYRRAHNVFGVL